MGGQSGFLKGCPQVVKVIRGLTVQPEKVVRVREVKGVATSKSCASLAKGHH